MKQKLFISIFFLLLSYLNNSYALEYQPCNDVKGYDLYTCRVKNICKQYKPQKFIYNTNIEDKKYLKLEPAEKNFLSINKKKYRENMNNLYKCSLLQVQINALNYIEKLEKDGDVKSKINKKIKSRKESLKRKQKICENIDDKTVYNKYVVLKQSTYEICKYINYINYLDYYSNTLSNTISEDTTVTQLAQHQINLKNEIGKELDHVLKVFPLAYTAYSEYENYITIHFVLELIREDFIIFRTRLHKILGPISQLLYKANNSMKLDDN